MTQILGVFTAGLLGLSLLWQSSGAAERGQTKAAAQPAAAESKTTADKGNSDSGAKPEVVKRPKIQLAILLDTSNSMDGLINQARTQLWKIVNEFAKASRDGQQPQLEVALLEYGKSTLPAETGHLRKIVDLTDNLDKISEELFALTTKGGHEYCGWVISEATKQLAWSKSEDDFKCIYIAGNEPFTQGSVDADKACQAAIAQGILVNTIHCGNYEVGVNSGWKRGAELADGAYVSIDQDRQVAAIATPHDQQLAQLSSELNKTFVYFGGDEKRKQARELQNRQDGLAAAAAPSAAADRAQFKASGLYRADNDLVEAFEKKSLDLKNLKAAELPEELRGKSVEDQQAYLAEQGKKRAELQAQIKELSAARDKFIAAARAKEVEAAGQETLDSAVIRTLRTQVQKKQFEIKE